MTKLLNKKVIIIAFLLIIVFVLFGPLRIQDKILKIIYPTKYENFVELYSKEYDVDKYLVYAIIKAESNFNCDAVSFKEAKGLMQLMDETAKDILKKNNINLTQEQLEEKLLQAEFNINLGTKYISMLIEKYQNIELALTAYNAGSGNVDNWIKQEILNRDGSNIENVPYKETNNYVRKILRDYEIYKKIYQNT